MLKKILFLMLCAGISLPAIAHEDSDKNHSHDEHRHEEGSSHDHDSDHGDHDHADGDHDHDHATLDSIEAKASYASGVRAARTLTSMDIDVDIDAFNQAVQDVMNNHPLALNEQEMREVNRDLARQRRESEQKKREKSVNENLAEAERFLAENKSKDGVITTASGLQYKVAKEGSGASPKASDRVNVNYEGKLLDGSKFDSSYDRGQPATFGVGQVIKGWTEVLQIMKPGSEYEVYIHPDLAYGKSGNRSIAPNSLLIFKVELLGIE